MEAKLKWGFGGKLAVLAGLIYGLGWGVPGFKDFAQGALWPGMVAGYAFMSWVLMHWVQRAAAINGLRFVNAVQGSTGIKLLITLSSIVVYILSGGPQRIPFALGFFVVYVANTVLFVLHVQQMNKIKPQ
jgi:hypothetical protein